MVDVYELGNETMDRCSVFLDHCSVLLSGHVYFGYRVCSCMAFDPTIGVEG
ncbi:hypothetical protein [Rhizobium sp. Leaf386]|uniref:hypothetical protein n=1 Tax=Rhizobium sp. Leaf386 TaxID=1736359 RepID=UPI000AB8781B|nr:hypothetical protein [Rhizobium sp. Leaf386]